MSKASQQIQETILHDAECLVRELYPGLEAAMKAASDECKGKIVVTAEIATAEDGTFLTVVGKATHPNRTQETHKLQWSSGQLSLFEGAEG